MMIHQQLLSIVFLVIFQQGVIGFLAPGRNNSIPRNHRLFASTKEQQQPSVYKSFSLSLSIPTNTKTKKIFFQENEVEQVRENDLSMFLAPDNGSKTENENDSGFDAMDFFMTKTTTDESIRKLEEVEDFFREEPMGIMMEEQTGVVPSKSKSNNPVNDVRVPKKKETIFAKHKKIKMTQDSDSIGIDEETVSKKVMYYYYDGSLTKIKSNLCDSPANYYTE